MSKKILIVLGSNREGSYNRQLASAIVDKIGYRAEVSFLNFSKVPPMNQDKEFPAPSEVEEVRNRVKNADGIWFVTPEYNSSYPGIVKNLVDWLSRPLSQEEDAPTTIRSKKVTISGAAGGSAAAGARGKLKELLEFVGANLYAGDGFGISISSKSWETGRLEITDEQRNEIAKHADSFLEFISAE